MADRDDSSDHTRKWIRENKIYMYMYKYKEKFETLLLLIIDFDDDDDDEKSGSRLFQILNSLFFFFTLISILM